MARGGYRPGAGRPKGARTVSLVPVAESAAATMDGKARSPLDYMLDVMNDPGADDGRRDRMAVAAAPYVHARAADAKLGKKEEAEQAAMTAERGTSWEHLLN
jgi:hypothetical protein